MSRERPRKQAGPIQASGICVWMSAGVLSYKLCDRDYDCDRCPLDAALRRGEPLDTSGPMNATAPLVALTFPSDRRYHPSHLWVGDLGGQRVRCGVDSFAARLLAHAGGVVLPAVRTHLERGRIACWMRQDDALVPLKAPVSGTVDRCNARLRSEVQPVHEDPYGAGWMFAVDCGASLDELPGLCSAEEQRSHVGRKLRRLERRVARHLAQDSELGLTLADGGELLVDLWRILGAERYARLVLRFLD